MMNRLYIDDVDILSEFGIFLCEGSYNALVCPAPLKKITSNNWGEEDGIEPDLSNPKQDTRQLNLSFGSINQIFSEDFLAFLSRKAYYVFKFDSLQMTRKLRLVSQQSKKTIGPLESFSLQFADDFPLDGYVYQAPIKTVNQAGFYLDNKALSDYGIYVTEGWYDEITKIPQAKKKLSISYANEQGVLYDAGKVVYDTKDFNLNCALVTPDIHVFWQNLNAFIYDLIRPGIHLLRLDKLQDEYPFYYKSCNVNKFVTSSKIWCELSFTLVFTDFRPKKSNYVIGTEDLKILGTEDLKALEVENYGRRK